MRIKLFNGSIPGFTDAEIAQRQAQSAADAAGRVGTAQSMSAPLMQTPMNNITPPSQTPTGPNVNVATGSGSGQGINSLPQSGTLEGEAVTDQMEGVLDEDNYTLAQALKDTEAEGPIIDEMSGVDVSGNVIEALKYDLNDPSMPSSLQGKSPEEVWAQEQADMEKYGSFYTPEGQNPRSVGVNVGKQAYKDILFAMQMDYPDEYAKLTGDETLAELDELSGRLAGYWSEGGRVNLRTGGDAVKFGSYLKTKNPKIKTTKNNKHEQLLRLLKQKQSRKLMSSLKKNLTNLNKSKNTSNANSKTISSAMKRLEALKKFYGRS